MEVCVCVCYLQKPCSGSVDQPSSAGPLKRRPQAHVGMHTEATFVHKTYTNPKYIVYIGQWLGFRWSMEPTVLCVTLYMVAHMMQPYSS